MRLLGCFITLRRTRVLALPGSALFLFCALSLTATTLPERPPGAQQSSQSLLAQRVAYQKAIFALNTGRVRDFHSAKKGLQDYALYPYLQYFDLLRNLNQLKHSAVANFQQRWRDSPLAQRLYGRWLLALAKRGNWQQYLKYYRPRVGAEPRCYYLRALYHTGQKQRSMAGVQNLWLTARSQPKACDPLFATWIGNGHLTTNVAWQRLMLALEAHQTKLARFLLRDFSGSWKSRAETLYRVYRQPKLLARYSNFRSDHKRTRDIIHMGLLRWAQKDARAAMTAWAHYRNSHSFIAMGSASIQQALKIQLARQDQANAVTVVAPSPDGRYLSLLEALGLSAIRQGDWQRVAAWISQMPQDTRAKPRWRYWRGRAALALTKQTERTDEAALMGLRSLARRRSYYGFLAADLLHRPARMNHTHNGPNRSEESRIRSIPGVTRALELFALDDLANARREWLFVSQRFSARDLALAANLAAEVGWVDQSIRTANAADLHDALELRFPTPWQSIFRKESYASGLPLALLYAIARQESTFDPRARSPANARGLMQLLPVTAAVTARRLGIKPPTSGALTRPAVNIKIGSQYLANLLPRYDGILEYALAAYNAGPQRVDRWLKEQPNTDPEVWTEAIPFSETRNYVQNVMAFERVYEQRLQRLRQRPIRAGYPLGDAHSPASQDSAVQPPGRRANPDLQSFPLR